MDVGLSEISSFSKRLFSEAGEGFFPVESFQATIHDCPSQMGDHSLKVFIDGLGLVTRGLGGACFSSHGFLAPHAVVNTAAMQKIIGDRHCITHNLFWERELGGNLNAEQIGKGSNGA